MFLDSQNQLAREKKFLSRIAVTVNGKPATEHDVRQFQTVTLLRYGLEGDLLALNSLNECVYRRVIHGITTVDLRGYASDLKYLKMSYLEWLQRRGAVLSDWNRFKRDVAGRLQYNWMLVALARLFTRPSATLQWLSFDERLLLNSDTDISMEVEEYRSADLRLDEVDLGLPCVEELRSIIGDWFANFSFADKLPAPRFGPGAVADGRGRIQAYEKACLCGYNPAIGQYLSQFWDVPRDELFVGRPSIGATYTNRVIFVPKNALSHRIISAEPAWLSWVQQAIKSAVFPYIERSHDMNTSFENQQRSRDLCKVGSIDGSYATIDFSACSDSISTRLVDQLFRETVLHDPLLLTRSARAMLPDGSELALRKFAPMGSACCFFTMDVILLSVCELAIRRLAGRHGRSSDYVVYGDDVIIRSEYASEFAELARSLGFRINEQKSFMSETSEHFYREACGIECLDGEDITPLRYSRFHEPIVDSECPTSPTYLAQNVSLLNRLYESRYFETRSVLWSLIKDSAMRSQDAWRVWSSVLRVDESDYAEGIDGPLAIIVYPGTATNYNARRRFNMSLWRTEYRVPTIQRRPVRRELDGLAKDLWDFAAEADSPKDLSVQTDYLSTVMGLQDAKVSWRWVSTKV